MPSSTIAIGTVMKSAHLRTRWSSRKLSRYSEASSFMWSTTSEPGSARVAGSSVKAPPPSEAQSQAASSPARRDVTVTRSATMKAE